MAISSPIGLKFGLLVILDRNDGQTKLEENISKNMDKMANNWPKIARKWPPVATIGQFLDRHNFAILHPIWTNDPTNNGNVLHWTSYIQYIINNLRSSWGPMKDGSRQTRRLLMGHPYLRPKS